MTQYSNNCKCHSSTIAKSVTNKNFTWEFDPAGFYTATLEVISWGDIVESLKTSKEIARSFGEDFSDAIDKAIINDWIGPYESSYGSHLVFVSAVAEEKVPELKQIRSLLISDIQMQQEQDTFKLYLDNLRNEYKVQVNPELIN